MSLDQQRNRRTLHKLLSGAPIAASLAPAAAASPDPSHSPDGINLLPVLEQQRAAMERTLCWRYHGNRQEACRAGKWKYLKQKYSQWNSSMLPMDSKAFTENISGSEMADHVDAR